MYICIRNFTSPVGQLHTDKLQAILSATNNSLYGIYFPSFTITQETQNMSTLSTLQTKYTLALSSAKTLKQPFSAAASRQGILISCHENMKQKNVCLLTMSA
jgi:hypothetical protein